MLTVISLGAGVQSSTMALMAAAGELEPMPDCAIVADTQAEPRAVYRWLDWLEPRLPFPVYRVTQGKLRDAVAAERPRGQFLRVDIPAFVVVEGRTAGFITRSCTRDYKIVPIRRKVRELIGYIRRRVPQGRVLVEQWIGISLDEIQRVKDSGAPWIRNRNPLIERRMSRGDCLEWMRRRGYPQPPKSSCIWCPYHNDGQWAALTPEEFAEAASVDDSLRDRPPERYRTKGRLYLHRSGRPLREIDFSRAAEPLQFDAFGMDNECEGVCGV